MSRNGKKFKEVSETPEEVVQLIGNIANRPDLREVQKRQVKEIENLIDLARWDEKNKMIANMDGIKTLQDALQACMRYFNAQDKINDCHEGFCRQTAVYLTKKALNE